MIFQYNSNFELVGEYQTVEEAANSVDRCWGAVYNCVSKKTITSAGFYWYKGETFLNNPEGYFKDLIENRKKQIPERTDIPKRVAQCNQDGDVIKVFDSIKAAARAFNIDKKGIRETLI